MAYKALILIVCSANIFRSPMAEYLAQRSLAKRKIEANVVSAGRLDSGHEASPGAVAAMARRRIDLRGHASARHDSETLAHADLVLVMEEAQRRTLFYTSPEQLHKIFLISEMSGDYRDIKDPYRRPKEEYERCADELAKLI